MSVMTACGRWIF